MRVLVFLSVLTACFEWGYSQGYKQLYDLALDHKFIFSKPLTKLHFEKYTYAQNFKGYIDSVAYVEIVNNSNKLDSASWTDDEVTNAILIPKEDIKLSWSKVYGRIRNKDKETIARFRRDVSQFNKTRPSDRLIFQYSRPIFSNEGNYAMIQCTYAKKGFGITFYQKKNNSWIELIDISTRF
jgi:hypothetical protein